MIVTTEGMWEVVLRPATAPGEDRNRANDVGVTYIGTALRPATAPGEDRNRLVEAASLTVTDALRPATAIVDA